MSTQDPDRVAVRVVVRGHVQGVFFRDTCRRQAAALGVAGWVRNRQDGTVEARFEGHPDAVGDLVAWAGHGPPRAQVEDVDTEDVEPTGCTGFEVG